MEAVTIHDLRSLGGGRVLAVDLIDLLRLCEPDALASSWRISYVDCMGDLAGEFMRSGDTNATVSGPELLRLATGVYQVIWGDFEAYRSGEERFWLVVRAIDASLYVVITEDKMLLGRVRSRFTDVRPSPEDAEYPDGAA
jgi:hypothetical protein